MLKMKFELLKTTNKKPLLCVPGSSLIRCSDPGTDLIDANTKALTPQQYPYITDYISACTGKIPVVSTILSSRDRLETIKARISSFRMNFSVNPGLYAVGNPDQNSDVFVTANYKMSFDALRSSLSGINGWIIVLDTKGINVWCAAGKGTFGTQELLRQISRTKISELVSHRKLILPQLGAPGISSGEIKRKSGFRVMYGPVRAEALTPYIKNGYKCDEEMRKIRFNLFDRLILTPIELRQVFVKYPFFAIIVLIFFGLTQEGIIFMDAIEKGSFFLFAGFIAILAGSFFTPIFLPFIPFRSFAMKGFIIGAVFFIIDIFLFSFNHSYNVFLLISAMIFFPLLSSYFALQFTGASTYTSLSGVQKELKIAFPIYVSGLVLSFIFLILYKICDWGLL